MAGIYLHIPFCRKKCYYCDFYKTTKTELIHCFLLSLSKEIELREKYLNTEEIQTIYLGGGTPSVLKVTEVESILHNIRRTFCVSGSPEITFEANPDDLTPQYLIDLKRIGINRLSLGIQSFNDEHLSLLNRRHNGAEAVKAIEKTLAAEFDNISVDLIFAIPGMTSGQFRQNLGIINRFPVNHLSAYYLTIHKGTRFYKMIRNGLLKEADESEGMAQFNVLIDFADKNGFEHYEISNFARNGCYSRHNSSYWCGVSYLGLGPSAHSFDQKSRQWNVSDLITYIKHIEEGKTFYNKELLSINDKFNEFVMTSLRTQWGIDALILKEKFDNFYSGFMSTISEFVERGLVQNVETRFFLTREGIFFLDKIISALFVV